MTRIALSLAALAIVSGCTYSIKIEPPPGRSAEEVTADKEACQKIATEENSLKGRAPPDSQMYRNEQFQLYSSCLVSRGYEQKVVRNP